MSDTFEIKVFVSCPGDVTAEKEAVKSICENLNNVLMLSNRKARFKVLDWRDIVTDMDGRPQEQINTIFSEYDIYIGILWMRFGTTTGASDPVTGKEYLSGTEEEFRLALLRKKDGERINIFLLFKEPEASKGTEATKQLLHVQEFYDEVKNSGWVMQFPIKPEITFSNKINNILIKRALQIDEQQLIDDKAAYLSEQSSEPSNAIIRDAAEFITKAPQIIAAIPRVLLSFEGQKNPVNAYLERTGDLQLIQVVVEKRLVILLGNAGSGKSTELAKLAHYYSEENTPFLPVYARMNTYVDEDLKNFLPDGWTDIPQSNVLIILDGLDEVQPQHFNTAVRKIRSFVESFPEAHIVISCRNNFYHLPDENSGGTLPDFNIYFLAEVNPDQTQEFAEENYQIDYRAFLKEARDQGFYEFTGQPFFLTILLKLYKAQGRLPQDRVSLLNMFLEQRITLDQQHFELTTNLRDHKEHILGLLQKIALVMEYLGRNYISYNDLLKILPNADDIQLVKFSTAFRSVEDGTNNWGFEHNNIQEFLAAQALLAFDLNRIKAFLSFKNERIKPSWLNTLFFLISLLPDTKRNDLIDWILTIEPEVLVRVEPDKVNEAARFAIFRTIFNHYKMQRVWLRSNKFSDRELAVFGEGKETLEFLIEEIGDVKNARTTRFNALTMLKYFKLSGNDLRKAKVAVLQYVLGNTNDQHIVHNGIYTLQSLGVADAEMIKELMTHFGTRSNQYIRSALYYVIIEAGLIDDYIDYFISGFVKEFEMTDRDNISLMDEDMLLREALANIRELVPLKKLLSMFEDPFDRRTINFFERNKILEKLIEKAVKLYPQHPELLDDVYKVYLGYGRHSEELVAQAVSEFFVKTNQVGTIFQRIFNDKKIEDYEKGCLFRPLVNKSNIDYVIDQYKVHNTTNEELLKFYNNLRWNIYRTDKGSELDYLTEQLNNETQVLAAFQEVDYSKIRAEKEQKSFDLYFNVPDFTYELTEFFKANGISELDWDTLWSYQYNRNQKNYEIPESVHDLLVDYTRGQRTTTLDTVLDFVNDAAHFANYRFSKIKDKVTNRLDVVVTEGQLKEIMAWVQQVIIDTDIVHAIKVENSSRTTYNRLVMVLWAFIKNYNIPVNYEKLLDFTLFDEVRNNDKQGLSFEVIEKQVGAVVVQERVRENLISKVEFDQAWQNNAIYALENSIPETLGLIVNGIFNENKSTYVRRTVMKFFIEQGFDPIILMVALKVTPGSDMVWDIIQEINHQPSVDADLRGFLKEKINNQYLRPNEKFKASTYLTEKGDADGTRYYLDYILDNATPRFDFYHQAQYMRMVRDINFLPTLLKLLGKANQPEYKEDDFNRFDSIVTDTLFNLGLTSEENLVKVKDALLDFIEENKDKIQHVNFLHPMIERMEFNFYLAQSQSNDIQDALNEVAKLYD